MFFISVFVQLAKNHYQNNDDPTYLYHWPVESHCNHSISLEMLVYHGYGQYIIIACNMSMLMHFYNKIADKNDRMACLRKLLYGRLWEILQVMSWQRWYSQLHYPCILFTESFVFWYAYRNDKSPIGIILSTGLEQKSHLVINITLG